MFKFSKLTLSSLKDFQKLNDKRLYYNSLNKEFFKNYYDKSVINRFFLRKEVYLIKYNDKICSYIWLSPISLSVYKVKAFYIDEGFSSDLPIIEGLFSFIKNKIIKNKVCKIKISPGFIIKDHIERYMPSSKSEIIELYFYYRNSLDIDSLNEKINIRKFIIKEDEDIRCYIQNVCFHSDGNNVINVNDIKYEERMNSFVKDGLIFAQINNKDVGFGQYIMNGYVPYIVNICVLPEYRSIGVGKKIVMFILKLIESHGHKIAKLKVESDNKSALNLYLNIGFEIVSEECIL